MGLLARTGSGRRDLAQESRRQRIALRTVQAPALGMGQIQRDIARAGHADIAQPAFLFETFRSSADMLWGTASSMPPMNTSGNSSPLAEAASSADTQSRIRRLSVAGLERGGRGKVHPESHPLVTSVNSNWRQALTSSSRFRCDPGPCHHGSFEMPRDARPR